MVVLLHGIGTSGEVFAEGQRRLGASHRSIALDLAGYGGSDDPPADFTLDGFAADVIGVLDAIGEPAAHLLGASFGALVAMRCAQLAPDRVRSLVLVDPTLGRGGSEPAERRKWLDTRLVAAEDPPREARARALAIVAPDADDEVIALLERLQASLRCAGLRAAAQAVASTDAAGWIAGLSAPILLVYGEHDRVTGRRVALQVLAARPDATEVVVPRAGHAPYVEKPGRFWEAIEEHLAHFGGPSHAAGSKMPCRGPRAGVREVSR